LSHVSFTLPALHFVSFLLSLFLPPPRSTIFPYTTLFRSIINNIMSNIIIGNTRTVKFSKDTSPILWATNKFIPTGGVRSPIHRLDRKSTRLNSSHVSTSYAGFRLKKTLHHLTPHYTTHNV